MFPLRTYEGFLQSQVDFFNDPIGTFNYQIKDIYESDKLGFVAVEADVRLGPSVLKKLYISFLFKKISDRWILVHDQNTVLPNNL